MKNSAAIITCALCTILILSMPFYEARAQGFVRYKVQVDVDGSAMWTITQASDLNGTIDTWKGFQQRIESLTEAAMNQTQREMTVDPNSLEMNTVWETQSQTTEYQFTWLNFSIIQNGQISFGDVFSVGDFFSQLYGDGELQISYPPTYTVKSVSPQPNGGNATPQTLDWLGTQFFVNSNPSIILTVSPSSSTTPGQATNGSGLSTYVLIGIGIALATAVSLTGFYLFKRSKPKRGGTIKGEPYLDLPAIETEEEKIIKLIQASGGSAFQSAITEKCRFSKAKTSQLLSALEKKGVVTRYKKGRDKIVTLSEKRRSETP